MKSLRQYEYKVRGQRGVHFVDAFDIAGAVREVDFEHGRLFRWLRVRNLHEWRA